MRSGGAEVGKTESKVGTDDADEGDAVDVVSLGDHLGADEEIDLASVEAGEQAFHIHAAADGVAVHASDASVGEEFFEALFALLRACAEVVKVLALAGGAGSSGRSGGSRSSDIGGARRGFAMLASSFKCLWYVIDMEQFSHCILSPQERHMTTKE